jgi:hypothetical protein
MYVVLVGSSISDTTMLEISALFKTMSLCALVRTDYSDSPVSIGEMKNEAVSLPSSACVDVLLVKFPKGASARLEGADLGLFTHADVGSRPWHATDGRSRIVMADGHSSTVSIHGIVDLINVVKNFPVSLEARLSVRSRAGG